jgi:hypothetical protein
MPELTAADIDVATRDKIIAQLERRIKTLDAYRRASSASTIYTAMITELRSAIVLIRRSY